MCRQVVWSRPQTQTGLMSREDRLRPPPGWHVTCDVLVSWWGGHLRHGQWAGNQQTLALARLVQLIRLLPPSRDWPAGGVCRMSEEGVSPAHHPVVWCDVTLSVQLDHTDWPLPCGRCSCVGWTAAFVHWMSSLGGRPGDFSCQPVGFSVFRGRCFCLWRNSLRFQGR